MEETVSLREYFLIIKKRLWVIVSITMLFLFLSVVLSFFIIKPKYEANSTLIVNTEENKETQVITGDQVTVTQKLAITYGEIIKSRSVMGPVIEKLSLDKTYEQLSKNINVSPVKDTQIINISVQDKSPIMAMEIANEIPKVFSKEAKRVVNANSVEVIDEAIEPIKPVKPNKIMNILIAIVLGLVVGFFVVFLIEYLDKKMKTPHDIERHLGLPVLGVVPNENIK